MEREGLTVWKIAAGVALGIGIALAVLAFSLHVANGKAEAQAAAQLRQIAEDAKKAQEDVQWAAFLNEQKRQDAEKAKRAAIAEQQHIEEDVRRTKLDQARLKEKAWAEYYKRPKRCEEPANGNVMMGCANEHIRAKRDFEEKYAEGKL